MRDVLVGPAGVSGCVVQNIHDGPVVLWIVEGFHPDLEDVPHSSAHRRIESGESTTVDLEDCETYSLYAIDVEAAEDQGRDPYGEAIEYGDLHLLPVGINPIIAQEDGDIVTFQAL